MLENWRAQQICQISLKEKTKPLIDDVLVNGNVKPFGVQSMQRRVGIRLLRFPAHTY